MSIADLITWAQNGLTFLKAVRLRSSSIPISAAADVVWVICAAITGLPVAAFASEDEARRVCRALNDMVGHLGPAALSSVHSVELWGGGWDHGRR